MSTAAQLLRAVADLVDAGTAPPDCIDLGSTGVTSFFFYQGSPGESWEPVVALCTGAPNPPTYIGDSPTPFTTQSWVGTFVDTTVTVHLYRDGDTRTAAEVLAEAAAHIRRNGLAQHQHTDESGACCVNGAIQHVTSGDATDLDAGQSAKRLFVDALGLRDDLAPDEADTDVEDLIAAWNDAPGRTAEQVAAALTRVADHARAEAGR